MDPLTISAGVLSLLGGTASILGGITGKKAGKKAGKEEAAAELLVTQAKIEDLRKEEEAFMGRTIAGFAGAGVKVGMGSPLEITAEAAREFARERRTIAQVGATRAAAATKRGRLTGERAFAAGISQGVSGLGSAFSLFADR